MDEGHRRFIVDLQRVELISSAGVGVLVGMLKRTRVIRKSSEDTVVLIATTYRVLAIIRITGLKQIFPVCANIDAALTTMYRQHFTLTWRKEEPEQLPSNADWFYARLSMSDARTAGLLLAYIIALIPAFGIRVIYQFPSENTPTLSQLALRATNIASQPPLAEQLIELYEALQRGLNTYKEMSAIASVDTAHAAVVKLLAELTKVSECLLQIGSILLVKAAGRLLLRNLNDLELEQLEIIPDLFRNPKLALTELLESSEPSVAKDSRRFILLLGPTLPGDALADRATAAGLVVRRKAFYPQPRNWKTITPLLQDPRFVAAIGKLADSEYRLFTTPKYESVVSLLLAELSAVPDGDSWAHARGDGADLRAAHRAPATRPDSLRP